MSDSNEALLLALAEGANDLTVGGGWPDGADRFLERLGTALAASRVWICQRVADDGERILWDYLREWAAKPDWAQLGHEDVYMFHADLTDPDYARVSQERRLGHAHALHVADLSGAYGRRLARHGTKTTLTAPILVEGEWWGTIGIDDCLEARDWLPAELSTARAAGNLIASSVLRNRLLDKRGQFELVLRATGAGYWDLDLVSQRHWWSPELLKLIGVTETRNAMGMRRVMNLIHPDDRPQVSDALDKVMRGDQDRLRIDCRVARARGGYVWLELLGYLTRDAFGVPMRLAGIAIDIQARKREEILLREQATYDALTQTLNRRAFEYTATLEASRCAGLSQPVSLLVLDLDHFKSVNDTHGHATGDRALRIFADLCRGALRDGDVLGRIGGEEFAVVLPGADRETALSVAERIRRRVAAHRIETRIGDLQLTVSIGAATARDAFDADMGLLIEKADTALYGAKRAGRNCLKVA